MLFRRKKRDFYVVQQRDSYLNNEEDNPDLPPSVIGRMVVIVDDENRENEGDLIFCGSFVSSEKINFMAKYARGLICLALDKKRFKKLNLKLMTDSNQSKHRTESHSKLEDWQQNLPDADYRAMCEWEHFTKLVRESKTRKVENDACVNVNGIKYFIDLL